MESQGDPGSMGNLGSWNASPTGGCVGVVAGSHGRARPRTTGVVFEDAMPAEFRDAERGLPGSGCPINPGPWSVPMREGRWKLPVLDGGETTFFVIAAGLFAALGATGATLVFVPPSRRVRPALRYPAFPRPDPDSIDFAVPSADPETFQAIFFGDTQPRDLREVDYFKHDLVEVDRSDQCVPLASLWETSCSTTLVSWSLTTRRWP